MSRQPIVQPSSKSYPFCRLIPVRSTIGPRTEVLGGVDLLDTCWSTPLRSQICSVLAFVSGCCSSYIAFARLKVLAALVLTQFSATKVLVDLPKPRVEQLPVERPGLLSPSVGLLPPLARHHHIHLPAAALRAHKPLAPFKDGHLRAVSLGLLGRICRARLGAIFKSG
jgi:hypothetical protein